MVKRSFYNVINGRLKGIFNNWDSCKQKFNTYEGAKYKSFKLQVDSKIFIKDKQSVIDKSKDVEKLPININCFIDSSKNFSSIKSQTNDNKFYAVNFNDGSSMIYKNWDECKTAIKGKKGITYKKFKNYDDALSFTKLESSNQLTHLQRQTNVDTFLRNNTKEMLKKQRESKPKIIYTDGSFFPSGHAGIGVYFGQNDSRNVSAPILDGANDSYKPEVYALDNAMKQISKEIEQFIKGEINYFPKYTISADNEAVKNILTKYSDHWAKNDFLKRNEGKTLYIMAQNYKKIKIFYKDNAEIFNDHEFEVKWVKGHSGVNGNEIADELAKKGALSKKKI